jgi:hypothetical protein
MAVINIIRWKSPAPEMFGRLKKHIRRRRFPSHDAVKADVQKLLREQNVSLYRQGLADLIVRYDKCLDKFGDYVAK